MLDVTSRLRLDRLFVGVNETVGLGGIVGFGRQAFSLTRAS